MEVIFLKRNDLEVLDFCFVDTDYQIIIDNVIPQKSNFTVNKMNINAAVGDLLVIKNDLNYIGIIDSIVEDATKFLTKITTSDFISILDIKVKLSSYSGNISMYLYNLISNAYFKNNDPLQNLNYLKISRDVESSVGTLNYESDTIDSISSVVSTMNKAYRIGISYSLLFDNGKISGIELYIKECSKGIRLMTSFAGITDLLISNSNEQSTNKVVFVPSDENTSHKTTICYYLLTSGTITLNSYDSLRYKSVSSITKVYKDADYSSLSTTAQSEMLYSSLEHSITFNLKMDNKVTVPFNDINVGDFIEFITPTKTCQTMITQFVFKSN